METEISKNFKSVLEHSLVFVLLFAVLATNYMFFGSATGLLTYALFYIMIFLLFLLFFIFLWFSFLLAQNQEVSTKEMTKNAIAYTVVHFIEMIILLTFMVAIILLIWGWRPGIMVFIGVAGLFALVHFVFTLIFEGHSLRSVFKSTWDKIF